MSSRKLSLVPRFFNQSLGMRTLLLPPTGSVISLHRRLATATTNSAGKRLYQPEFPATTRATVRFFAGTNDSLPPVLDFDPNRHTTNLMPGVQTDVDVTDIRYFDPPTSLKHEGCEWVRFTTKLRESNLSNNDAQASRSFVETVYFPECAELVKRRAKAKKAVAYHHRHREQKGDPEDIQGFSSKPVVQFHIDNDSTTAEKNLRNTVGDEEADYWMQRHWGILNVWRPLGDVVRQYPLALLDSRKYDVEKASVKIKTRTNYKSHFLGLKQMPEYEFYYVSNMAPDEVLMFVDYDSDTASQVSGLGHGAMFDHASPQDAPLRRSIEVRVLVLYDE